MAMVNYTAKKDISNTKVNGKTNAVMVKENCIPKVVT